MTVTAEWVKIRFFLPDENVLNKCRNSIRGWVHMYCWCECVFGGVSQHHLIHREGHNWAAAWAGTPRSVLQNVYFPLSVQSGFIEWPYLRFEAVFRADYPDRNESRLFTNKWLFFGFFLEPTTTSHFLIHKSISSQSVWKKCDYVLRREKSSKINICFFPLFLQTEKIAICKDKVAFSSLISKYVWTKHLRRNDAHIGYFVTMNTRVDEKFELRQRSRFLRVQR